MLIVKSNKYSQGPSKRHNVDKVDNVDNVSSYYSALINSAKKTIFS